MKVILSVPDEGYSRNPLNLISMFLFFVFILIINENITFALEQACMAHGFSAFNCNKKDNCSFVVVK